MGVRETLFVKGPMDESDGNRAFPDRRGNALHATSANVADGEDSWQTRLEQVRNPGEGPVGFSQIFRRQIGSGLDESRFLQGKTATQPLGAGDSTHHREHVPNRVSFVTARPPVAPSHALEL